MNDDRQRQTEEVEVLRAMFGVENVSVEQIRNDLIEVQVILMDLISDSVPVILGGKVPARYPSTEPLQCFISCTGWKSDLTNEVVRIMNEKAKENLGQEAFFILVEHLRDYLVSTDSTEDIDEGVDINKDVEGSKHHVSNKVLGRRLLYSHHIASTQKRQIIKQWGEELSLGVLCKLGWPGIIICEGQENCCVEYVRRIQGLRWKHIVVRGEQTEVLPAGEGISQHRVLALSTQEFSNDEMSLVAKICRDAGIENLFLTAMKIYREN